MSSAAGYLLTLTGGRRQAFRACLYDDTRLSDEPVFAEPVPEFSHSRNVPLVCFLSLKDGYLTHLGEGARGLRAGYALRRLNISKIVKLSEPISLDDLLQRVRANVRSTVSDRISNGGLLPQASFDSFVDALIGLSPEARRAIGVFSRQRRERIGKLSDVVLERLTEQKEAVATALTIADIDRKSHMRGWDVDDGHAPRSFLDGLESVRLREDAMVVHDLNSVPGFDLVRTAPHNSAVFRRDGTTLTVILANRLPLETTTGTDLIYFNENHRCFIMVQYKAMDRSKDEAYFRLPDELLHREITRMSEFYVELGKCDPDGTLDGFRFSDVPFFIKLCPRTVFDPDNVGLIKGMYFPLLYWQRLEVDSVVVSSRGGRAVTFRNSRRHFDNTSFISLVKGGWVGTTGVQSECITSFVSDSLRQGRALAFAVKSERSGRSLPPDTNAD
jgi:hypothetical protein